ncbi:DUF2187 family protein [Metabacillus malikii]|uniref:Uncharacterized protein YkvS n=1 Tax=Metabacillus malikii TaxID=1504265 RepID=A0ABT9ZC78_9BACI|nr:DUF2187 family protein [Metabacillus malikii]MDQ0229847.1 uncharacterized protein YkvS [Metabacillus malikii]
MTIDGKIAKEGDKILFTRNGIEMIGEVFKVREESVIVSISKADAYLINVETPLTVVSHKNYQIITQ